jgi:site-specific DNA-methyltransferase (adenine-specific)
MIPVSTNSRQDFETPQWFFDRLNDHYNFTLDAAATSKNKKCKKFFGRKNSALKQSWMSQRIFCNPPYEGPAKKCERGCDKDHCRKRGYHFEEDYTGLYGWLSQAAGAVIKDYTELVVFVLPANTGVKWFHQFAPLAVTAFIHPRIAFEVNGKPLKSPPHASMLMEFTKASIGTRLEGGALKTVSVEYRP